MYKVFCRYVFISLAYIPKGGIAGSYGNSVYLFEEWFSKSSCIILHFQQQCMNIPRVYIPASTCTKNLAKLLHVITATESILSDHLKLTLVLSSKCMP